MKWSRPYASSLPFCAVTSRTATVVRTACSGSWSATEAEESVEEPPAEERCGRCWAVQRAKERAAGEMERFEETLVEREQAESPALKFWVVGDANAPGGSTLPAMETERTEDEV